MSELLVAGVEGDCPSFELSSKLKSFQLIVGSERFLTQLRHLQVELLNISPLAEALDKIEQAMLHGLSVAVLASGDPLFYGIGRKLGERFPDQNIRFLPSLTSVQQSCARFGLPWDDGRIISLHGRNYHHLPGLLLRQPKSILFTDKHNSPSAIAQTLIDYLELIDQQELIENTKVLVAADLGRTSEELFEGNLSRCSRTTFASLNIMILLLPDSVQPHTPGCFGLQEEDILHSRGLITKNEVRAATLHHLALPASGIFWDIGAGSGSISIEAARMHPHITVYAIERNAEQIKNIKNNIVKFGCYNIVPIHGECPEALTLLPDPSTVFIGGSGGNLADIIAHAASRLDSRGTLVVNGVIAKTIEGAPPILQKAGLQVTSSTIQVTRTAADGTLLKFNPITIMTGRK